MAAEDQDLTERERIDELDLKYAEKAASNRELILKFAYRTSLILVILVLVQLGLGALSVYLITQNNNRQNDIQKSRVDAVVQMCVEQNARHDNTIGTLDRILAQTRPRLTPKERQRSSGQRDFTILLINALAPKQNCAVRAKQLTK